MAKYCPKACGRLAIAAIFISVAIVQTIAGIIFLKLLKFTGERTTPLDGIQRVIYADMLSGPNIWTALCNLSVGVLLGISSTVWKNMNKNSCRHSTRRKLLASLVSSIFILNAITTVILIFGEGNKLLDIYIERADVYSNKTVENEILAYTYVTSVCSPVVCVVVSIAFLTGICCRRKPKTIKTLDIKNISNEDSQMYNWVYASNLPKPDPGILKAALSSESETSSSESESESSADLPVPLHLRSRSSLNGLEYLQHESLKNSHLQLSTNRSRNLDDSVFPDSGEIRYIPRLKSSSLIRTPVSSCNETVNSYRSVGPGKRLIPAMLAYKSDCKPGTPVRIGTSGAFEKSTYSPNFQYNTVSSPYPKTKLFSSKNQFTPNRLRMKYESKCVSSQDPSTSRKSSLEDSTEHEDSVLDGPNLVSEAIYSPNPHWKVCRTSTAHQTKVHQEFENLDNSAIHCDNGASVLKEIYMDETLPVVKDNESLSSPIPLSDSLIVEKDDSFYSGRDMSILVRNSNFRKKLSSKLVPAEGPAISNNCSFYKTSNRKSTRRMKPYSKSRYNYDKYLQTGFSSFKERGQVDEVDAAMHSKKQSNIVKKSPETSVSENSAEDSFLPSTSTHTSGYMSASYEESEDESDLKPNSSPVSCSKRQPLSAQKLIADEIRERYRKKTGRVAFESDNERIRQDGATSLNAGRQVAVSKTEV